mgnify:FL=1
MSLRFIFAEGYLVGEKQFAIYEILLIIYEKESTEKEARHITLPSYNLNLLLEALANVDSVSIFEHQPHRQPGYQY